MPSEPLPSLRESIAARHRRVRRKAGRDLRWRLTHTAIGFGAFLITCIVLHALLPFPEVDAVSAKLRYFRAHKDEYDTLFIGSSRIYYQVSPRIFDHVTAERGCPTRSFNFGIGGMHFPESAYMLDKVLDTKPRNLKWVFVEYDELQTNWFFEGQNSRRALYWHDWKRTALIVRKLTDAGTAWFWLPNLKKIRDALLQRKAETMTLKLLSFYAAQFQKNFTNVARGTDVIDYVRRPPKAEAEQKYLGENDDGYLSLSKQMSPRQRAAYERALAELLARTRPRSISPYTVECCRQCAARIRQAGAVPIFLATPSITAFDISYHNNEAPPGVVLAFNNPRAYPQLYRSEVRMDRGHLLKPAAEEFTALVAAKFAELVHTNAVK